MPRDETDTIAARSASDRRQWPVVIALVVVIAAIGAFAWVRGHPTETRMCTAAGAIGSPRADSPQAAFDAWWRADGRAAADHWTSYGPARDDDHVPTQADYTRLDDTTWEWRYTEHNSVRVEVGRPQEPGESGRWTVLSSNRCSYG
jgi:hypothetical protein